MLYIYVVEIHLKEWYEKTWHSGKTTKHDYRTYKKPTDCKELYTFSTSRMYKCNVKHGKSYNTKNMTCNDHKHNTNA